MQNTKKEEEHVADLLKRVRVAYERSQLKKLKHCMSVYLNSFDARYVAAQRANRRRKIKDRLDEASVRTVATRLNAWKGTDEAVLVHAKRKSSNPGSSRTYMAFGIENSALQYLVLSLLEQIADIDPCQYTIRGGIHAAIKHVAKVMSTGPLWAVEVDVIDCYPSFDGKKLKDLLPLPKEVSDNVLISEHLNLKGGNIANMINTGPFGPAGGSKASMTLEGMLAAARRGIPQGSAASPLIAETVLATALRQIPDLGDKVGYGDNTLLMAKEASDMVPMLEALESAFEGHPVGLLTPKRRLFKPGEPVEFLGHRLIPQSSGNIRIEPSQKAEDRFLRKMRRQLNRLKYEKLSLAARVRARRKARGYVLAWTSAFSLCDGIDDQRAYWLKRIATVS